MAMVWIKQFTNNSARTITLKQNDPNCHPLLHSGNGVTLPQSGHPDGSDFRQDFQVREDQPIIVKPGGSFICDWFVIPWADSGRLLLEGGQGNGTLEISVGPFGNDNADYIHFVAKGGATPVPDVRAGDRGPHIAVELTVHVSEQGGIVIDTPKTTDYIALAKQLYSIAMELWNIFNSKPAGTPAKP